MVSVFGLVIGGRTGAVDAEVVGGGGCEEEVGADCWAFVVFWIGVSWKLSF